MLGPKGDPNRNESLDRPSRRSASQGFDSGGECLLRRGHHRSCLGSHSRRHRIRFRCHRGSCIHLRRPSEGGIEDFGPIGTPSAAWCASRPRSQRRGTSPMGRINPPPRLAEAGLSRQGSATQVRVCCPLFILPRCSTHPAIRDTPAISIWSRATRLPSWHRRTRTGAGRHGPQVVRTCGYAQPYDQSPSRGTWNMSLDAD